MTHTSSNTFEETPSSVLTLSANDFEPGAECTAAYEHVKNKFLAFKKQPHSQDRTDIVVDLSQELYSRDRNEAFGRGFARLARDVEYHRKRDSTASESFELDLTDTKVPSILIRAPDNGDKTASIIKSIHGLGFELGGTVIRTSDQMDAHDSAMWAVASNPTGVSHAIFDLDFVNLSINSGYVPPGPEHWPRELREQLNSPTARGERDDTSAETARPFFAGIVSDVKATAEGQSILDTRTAKCVSLHIGDSSYGGGVLVLPDEYLDSYGPEGKQRKIDLSTVRSKITGTFATAPDGKDSGFYVTNTSEGGVHLKRYLADPSADTRSALISHLRSTRDLSAASTSAA